MCSAAAATLSPFASASAPTTAALVDLIAAVNIGRGLLLLHVCGALLLDAGIDDGALFFLEPLFLVRFRCEDAEARFRLGRQCFAP